MSDPIRSQHLSLAPSLSPSKQKHNQAIEIRNQRACRHSHLVGPLARHYGRCCGEPLEDLHQVGLLGLLRAAELYKPAQATPFSAFARPHIRGAILHHLRDRSRMIRLPRRHQELADRVTQWHRLHPQVEGQAGELQLLRDLGLNRSRWIRFQHLQRLARPTRLEDMNDEELGRGEAEPPSGETTWLLKELAALKPMQRQAIELVVLAGVSLRQAGTRMKRSPASVRRDVQRGLDELRRRLRPAEEFPGLARAGVPEC